MREDTIVWISGATQGIGLGLARTVPYPNARIINLSRRQHPDYETVQFDLTRPADWEEVGRHFAETLGSFKGQRAIFIQNAVVSGDLYFTGEGAHETYMRELYANVMAPLVLGEAFLRAVRPDVESGLVMMSSAAARGPLACQSVYCAGKAGLEHWVRCVRRERKMKGTGPWVIAVRPGFVDTPQTRAQAAMEPAKNPNADKLQKGFDLGMAFDIETAGRQIWEALPPKEDTSVLLFGMAPSREL